MDSPNLQPPTVALTECDRRLHPRYTVQVQIELRLEGNDVPMRLATTDLSRAGCYIELMIPSPSALTFKHALARRAPDRHTGTRHNLSSPIWQRYDVREIRRSGRTIPATVPGRHRHHDLAPRPSSNARFPIRTIGNVHPSPSGTSAASNST
jgi:hypothetical protein